MHTGSTCKVYVLWDLYTVNQPVPLRKHFQIPVKGTPGGPAYFWEEKGNGRFSAYDIISYLISKSVSFTMTFTTILFHLPRCLFFFLIFGGFISLLPFLSEKTDDLVSLLKL